MKFSSGLVLSAVFAAAGALSPVGAQSTKDMIATVNSAVTQNYQMLQDLDRKDEDLMREVGVLKELLNAYMERVDRLSQAVAVIERAVNKQSDQIVPPLTRTAAKVDALGDQFGGLRDAVEESNTVLTRLAQDVKDIKTQLTTMPPPGYTSSDGAASASTLDPNFLDQAVGDYTRGNYDFAKEQFRDFLRLDPNGSRAPEARFYLGLIAYDQGDYAEAVKEFDAVLEQYPVRVFTPDAQYKKGLALQKLGRTEDAVRAFQNVVERFPNSSVAPNSQAMIDEIRSGSSGGGAAAKPSPIGR